MVRVSAALGGVIRWALALCAVLLVLLALYVSLGRQLIPLVAEYDGQIEARASEALGMPVRIGSLEGRWNRLAPVLLIHDVQVGEGSNALRLDQVKVVPDLWGSLLARAVRIAHLEVGGVQLSAVEDATGKWSIKGVPQQPDQAFDVQRTLQQMQQVEQLSVLDSQLTLQPYEHDPLTLTYVGLSLRTGDERQRLDLRLHLPDGQPLALNIEAQVRAEHWRDGRAQAYANLPQSDWAKWLPSRYTQGWKLDQLKAGGEVWVDWADANVQRAVVQLDAPAFKGAYVDHKPYTIADLTLKAWMQRNTDGFDVNLGTLAMTLDGKPWQSHMALQQRAATPSSQEQWRVQADRLDLTPITPLLDALAPLPKQVAAIVNGLNFTGVVRNLSLDVRPKATGAERLSYAANLENVGFDAYYGAPAADNVSGSLIGDIGQGELRLDSDKFMLHLSPIFEKPWHYLKANARLNFKLDDHAFTLIAPAIRVLGEEGKIAADFLIRLPLHHEAEPYMDLRVGLVDGDGAYTSKYLPKVLSPSVDQWLRTAIKRGAVDQGYFQYQGSLASAAEAHSRSITLFFKVHDVTLAFQPGWPEARKVAGNVYIQDGDVRILADRGQILDTKVSDVAVSVPHVPVGQDSHLFVNGNFDGGLADGLKILQTAPIGTADIFAGWQGEGPLKGKLELDIPLVKGHEPKVVVDFSTRAARLKIKSPELALSQLGGTFRFDFDKGLSGEGVTAQAFDQPVKAQILAEGKPGAPLTRIVADSQIPVKRLVDWLQVKQAVPASGDIAYQLQLKLGSDSQLRVDSDLKGVDIDLPAPFGKARSVARPTAFVMNLQGRERRFDVTYADIASFAYAAPPNDLASGRGELLVGAGTPQLPATQGLRVRGALQTLDLEPWQQQAENYTGGNPSGTASQIINAIDLQIGTLKGFGQQLDQARVQLNRSPSAWHLAVASQQITGKVDVPDGKATPINVDLDTVRLPPVDPNAVKADNPVEAPDPLANVDPRKIPAVNVRIRQLLQGPELVGSWSLKLRPTARGVALNELDLGLKGLMLHGAATWEGAPGASSTWFRGRLQGKNLADVLQAWKFAPTVTSESFHLDADGRWPGSPAWVGLKRFSGNLDATLRDGQFVEVEGGAQALRVFGLLNFNAIGRRLRLDFSDVLGKGLSYDRVKGLLVASEGVYVTRTPITLRGPSTDIDLDGTLDMVRDGVNAKVQVALPITNSLPLAAVLVGAPVVGGALFVVNKLLGDRVARFASVQYRIEGSWKDPQMTLVKPFGG